MEETLDYNSMPRDFAHCLNAGCERAGECLRHRMALLMPAERGTVTIVNPRAVDPSGRDCAYFKPGQAVTYALGITRLLDDLISQGFFGHGHASFIFLPHRGKGRRFLPWSEVPRAILRHILGSGYRCCSSGQAASGCSRRNP